MAAIFAVSSLHEAPLPAHTSDKLAHAVAYAGLGGTLGRALAGGLGQALPVGRMATGWAIAVAYGASDEWHQHLVAGRSSDPEDLVADAIGAAVGLVAWWACGILFRFLRPTDGPDQ